MALSIVVEIVDKDGVRIDPLAPDNTRSPVRLKLGPSFSGTATPNGSVFDIELALNTEGASNGQVLTFQTEGPPTWNTISGGGPDLSDRVFHVNYTDAADNAAVPSDFCGLSVVRGASSGTYRDFATIAWLEPFQTWAFFMNAGGDDHTIVIPAGLANVAAGSFSANTGDSDFGGFKVKNLAAPTNNSDAATKQYVDTAVAGAAGVVQPLQLSALAQAGGTTSLGTTYTVGVQFFLDHAANVSGGKFFWLYSGSGTDHITVSLWSGSTMLATGTTTTTANGELTVTFSPVSLVSGVPFWISYCCTNIAYTPYAQAGGGAIPSQTNPATNFYGGGGVFYGALSAATIGVNQRPTNSFAFGSGTWFPIQPVLV